MQIARASAVAAAPLVVVVIAAIILVVIVIPNSIAHGIDNARFALLSLERYRLLMFDRLRFCCCRWQLPTHRHG